MNIVNLFHNIADRHSNSIAIVEKNNSITYKELQRQVIQTAVLFESKGIKKGDRILVFVPMSIDLYRVILAIFHCGATAVFLDEWVNKKRMEVCCELADCQGFVGVWKARVLSFFSKELRRIPVKLPLRNPQLPLIHKKESIHEASVVTAEDSALITFTTGSTGIPKAADRTHGFLKAQFDVLKTKINPQVGDVAMPVLPIVLLINLASGSTSVIAEFNGRKPQKWKPEKTIRQIKKHKVNRITASPFFIKGLAKSFIKKRENPGFIRQIFTGGAPVFPDEAKTYLEGFPNTKIQILYGSTEAEPISGIEAEKLASIPKNDQKDGLNVGKIHPKTQLRVIPIIPENLAFSNQNDFDSIMMKKGEIGEIIVAGDHVLKQYFNNQKAWNENKIPVGSQVWHRTGDSGFLDKNGDLFLTGRCKQLIKKDTDWLSPFIYENRLQVLPEIEIGTILNIDSQLVMVAELAECALKEFARKRIYESFSGEFDKLVFIKKIPRDPRHHSKIEYGKLRSLIGH